MIPVWFQGKYLNCTLYTYIFLMYVWVPEVGNTADTPNRPCTDC